jgi:hypothetical protein
MSAFAAAFENDVYELTEGSVTVGDAEEIGGGTGGNDQFDGYSGVSGYIAFGDAYALYGRGRGGNDTFQGGDEVGGGIIEQADIGALDFSTEEGVVFAGDADEMYDRARGGNDQFDGGTNSTNLFVGDALDGMYERTAGGNDLLNGGDAYAFEAEGYSSNTLVGDAYSFGDFFIDDAGVQISAEPSNVAGGKDTLTGGDAYAIFGSSTVTNEMTGDAYAMGSGSGGKDILQGGSAGGFSGEAQAQNLLLGDGYIMGGTATGGADQLTGGDAYAAGGGDAYAFNIMTGDAYGLFEGARAGNDVMTGGNAYADGSDGYAFAFNVMAGDTFFDDGAARFGDDQLTGGSGTPDSDAYAVNLMYGDVGEFGFFGPRSLSALEGPGSLADNEFVIEYGDDVLTGGMMQAENMMVGDAAELAEGSVGGRDLLIGGGEGTENTLVGDAMAIWEGASAGRDVLVSGAGDDVMWGDAMEVMEGIGAADRFVFSAGNGNDRIEDFSAADGDKIDLRAFGKEGDFRGFNAFLNSGRVEEGEDGVILYLDAEGGLEPRGDVSAEDHLDGSITLVGLSVEDLTASMFAF